MTRNDLTAIGNLTDDRLAVLTCVESASIAAMLAQRDAADAKVEAAQKLYDDKYAALQAEMTALKATHVAALAAKDADKTAALAEAATAATAAQAAAVAAAVEPLNAQIATLTVELAATGPAQTAAVNAAVTPLNAEILSLMDQVSDLTAQLAGSKGNYKVTLTAAQEVGLQLEAKAQNVGPLILLNATVSNAFGAIASARRTDILTEAIGKYPSLPAQSQAAICTALGLGDIVTLPMPTQLQLLGKLALDAFNALPQEQQNGIMAALGL